MSVTGTGTGADGGTEPDGEIERLRAALYAPGAPAEAAERYRAALARATPAPDAVPAPAAAAPAETPAAEESPGGPVGAPRSRHRIRSALVAGGLLLAAGIGVVLLVPHPEPEFAAPPLKLGPALWTAHGVNGASSPDLDGGHLPLLVRLRCRGEGRVLLSVDGRVRTLSCAKRRSVEDDQLFDGPHDQFLLALSLVGRPNWSVSVHRVLSPPTG